MSLWVNALIQYFWQLSSKVLCTLMQLYRLFTPTDLGLELSICGYAKFRYWSHYGESLKTPAGDFKVCKVNAGLDNWPCWVMFSTNLLRIIYSVDRKWMGQLLPFLESVIHVSEKVCACVFVCVSAFVFVAFTSLPTPPLLPVAKCWNVPICNMTLSQWKGKKKKKKDGQCQRY